jgi:predicted component of type VI protein secretion system
LDFDVQVVLAKEDVPGIKLAEANGHTPPLGWNTWLCSKPATKDAENAVFEGRELTPVA